MFQVVYVVPWDAAVNQLVTADYMGTLLVHGHLAGPSPLLIAGVALAMHGATFAIRAAQHAAR